MRRLRPALLTLALLSAGGAHAQSGASDITAPPELRAQLSPVRSTILSAEIPGKIDDLTVREGDRFTEGQRLVALDCGLHRARLDKAVAQEQAARRNFEVKVRLDRLRSISALELDTAAAELAAAEAESAVMRILTERCEIPAPFTGRVVEVKVKRHQYVAEGQELIEILDDRALEVEVMVPSRWLGWLAPGAPFTLRVDETGRDYPASVTRLSARIDPVSQSIKIFGTVSEGHDDLLPGMSGAARFTPPQ